MLAVELVRSGEAANLMKGSLHTDELLRAVLHRRRRVADRTAAEPLLPPRRSDLRAADHPHGCRHQHQPRPQDEARHLPERHRPCSGPRPRPAKGGDPLRPSRPLIQTCLQPLMLPRSARWPIAVKSREVFSTGRWHSTTRSDEEAARTKGIVSPIAGRADILWRPRSRGGQHAGQAALVFMANARGSRHPSSARASPMRANEPRRQRADPAFGVLRRSPC